jgi:DNA-binding LytR/AlgR family response regulator
MHATKKLVPHGPNPMRLLIVDQEPMVRTELARLCLSAADLQVVGEADSGGAAIDAAQNLSPDVMLIDVALPDMSGFDVLRDAVNSGPLGIMTSRRPDYAQRALAEGAVDYLIKPVSADRFERAIARVRQRHTFVNRPRILVGERQHRLYPLDVEKIEYIEADGNYVTIRAGNQEYISRDTIKRLSVELASLGFVRIDRSTLLNIRAIHFAEPVGHGTLAFTLSSGACLHSSKTYRGAIQRVLPWHHCRAGTRS